MLTHAEENYLKVIYHLSLTEEEGISTNAIANKMDTKASSVTDMLKKLSEKELINYKKYKGVFITQNGKLTAKMIIRKHRLWEVFLVEKLNFNWDEVHELAEELEHIKSEKLITDGIKGGFAFISRRSLKLTFSNNSICFIFTKEHGRLFTFFVSIASIK